jgi:hypothetical protein
MMVLCGLSGITSFLIWSYFFTHNSRLKGVFVGTMCSLLVFCIGLITKKLGNLKVEL